MTADSRRAAGSSAAAAVPRTRGRTRGRRRGPRPRRVKVSSMSLRAQAPPDPVEQEPFGDLDRPAPSSSARNTMISSIRLRNSGRKWDRSSCIRSSFSSSNVLLAPGVRLDPFGAEVARHDHDGVLEVHGAALGVGEPSVVQDLQQEVEHVGVRLLDLVKQDHRVGLAPDGLGQLPGLLVADVPGRRPDEPADGVPLLELAHVEPDHQVVVAEQDLGERPGELRLARRRSARGTGSSRRDGSGPRDPPAHGEQLRRRPPRPRPDRSRARGAAPPA